MHFRPGAFPLLPPPSPTAVQKGISQENRALPQQGHAGHFPLPAVLRVHLLAPYPPQAHFPQLLRERGELIKPPVTTEDSNVQVFPEDNGEPQKAAEQGETG